MHFKRRKFKKILAVCTAILFTVMVASLTFWLLFSGILNFSSGGKYALPQNGIKGITLATQNENAFTQMQDTQQQQTFINDFISFAVQSDMNSVFIEMLQTSNGETTSFARESSAPTIANVKSNDTLISKFDAMDYLCTVAAENGINVYALYNIPTQDNDIISKSAKNVMQKYPISGVFYKNAVTEGLGTLVSEPGDSIVYTSSQVWADPSQVFLHTITADYKGLVIDNYDYAKSLPNEYSLMAAAMQTNVIPTLLNYDIPNQLTVQHPVQGESIYTSTYYVMGSSDPSQPLLLDGVDVPRNTTTGAFGILVQLEQGSNTFVFSQGDTVLTHEIYRGYSSSSSGSSSSSSTSDSTVSVDEGTYVEVSGWIASLLYDNSADNYINETVRQGGTAKVVDSVQTYRNGYSTWAYKLTSGDYILAYNTNILGTNIETPTFTGASATLLTNINGEVLTFEGSGTPMAYTSVESNTLSVRMYDTSVSADFNVTGSEMVQSVAVNNMDDGGVEILFTFEQPLYGHSIEYKDGTTQLYLKHTPQINTQDPLKPLAGVSVLLDAGHGDTDTGALGVMGIEGPNEKEANLAVTIAAKYRLEQLGATVYTIRTDDTFYTLEERNKSITEYMPDFFISVHHNSILTSQDATDVNGVECYYFYDDSQLLAQTLVSEIVQATNRNERGANWGYYYVARNTICPAVLLECAFMRNPLEYEGIIDDDVTWAVGDAIASSILQLVSSQNTTSVLQVN